MPEHAKKSIPKALKRKCHAIIHSAAATAGASGLIPLPVADTIPMSSAQVAMVIALGRLFDISISESTAKALASVAIAQNVGKTTVATVFKCVPGIGTVAGMAVASTTGAALTELMGWVVADYFYRISQGEAVEEVDLLDALSTIQKHDVFGADKWRKRGRITRDSAQSKRGETKN